MSPYLTKVSQANVPAATTPQPEKQPGSEASEIISTILSCYSTLSKVSSLKPSTIVNETFEKLVSTCILIPDEAAILTVLADKRIEKIISHLQHLCSLGEGYLEAFWAERITSDKLALIDFPYYSNYVDLTRLELDAVASSCLSLSPSKFAFIGSGPLPMTSFCILSQLQSSITNNTPIDISILNIDRDLGAYSLSSALSQHLRYTKSQMSFSCNAADSVDESLEDCDVVYLAALVGSTASEKRQIIRSVVKRMRVGSLLVVRSAWGLRTLLYPAIQTADLEAEGLLVTTIVHPRDHVVNSVIVARVLGLAADSNSVGNSESSDGVESSESNESSESEESI